MAIEKVFAIEADPEAIWEALWTEVLGGQEGAFSVEAANRPHSLRLNVDLGGLPSVLIYRIEAKDGHSEVAAELVPLSLRYRFYQVLTFGHMGRNYEMMLVQGLSNLKTALEQSDEQDGAGDGAELLEEEPG